MNIQNLKGKIDFGIITIREDEFGAVLKRFPPMESVQGRRRYAINLLKTNKGEEYLNALVRCTEMGEGEAQSVAHDLINDLDPQWILVVGIGGGIPADEFTLGDVVAAMQLLDFSVSASIERQGVRTEEFAVTGGQMNKKVRALLAHLPAMESELGEWNSKNSIIAPLPPVLLSDENFYGDSEWKNMVRSSLEKHFVHNPRQPKVTTGTVVSSDRLVKDTKILKSWLQNARQLRAMEMELGGIYRAARQDDKEYPILAIRGISDIVGFKRDTGWTTYACHSAASFALALLQTQPIPARSHNLLTRRALELDSDKGSIITTSLDTVMKIQNLFDNQYVLPTECDRSINELKTIERHLHDHFSAPNTEPSSPSPSKYLHLTQWHIVEEKIHNLISLIHVFRDECLESSLSTEGKWKDVYQEISLLLDEIRVL